jgi:hypothetical protein
LSKPIKAAKGFIIRAPIQNAQNRLSHLSLRRCSVGHLLELVPYDVAMLLAMCANFLTLLISRRITHVARQGLTGGVDFLVQLAYFVFAHW